MPVSPAGGLPPRLLTLKAAPTPPVVSAHAGGLPPRLRLSRLVSGSAPATRPPHAGGLPPRLLARLAASGSAPSAPPPHAAGLPPRLRALRVSAYSVPPRPVRGTFAEALRDYLLDSLPGLAAAYRRQTAGQVVRYPCALINFVGADPELNTSGVSYPEWLDVQLTFVASGDDADLQAEALRDAAYRLFTPRHLSPNPPLLFGDGSMPPYGSVPGRKWEWNQSGKGPSGKQVWLFAMQVNFYLTRAM